MAIVLLQFSSLSSPVAVGDQAYYIDNLAVSAGDDAFSFGTNNNNVISLGPVVNVEGNSIYVDVTINVDLPTANDYVFISKDNQVQLSSVIGYYAEVKMVNDSTSSAELYGVAIDSEESSK
jgi:hypothetical protein|tara:strand:- start:9087 stop:9449 length:363 start_codon:yes stop_codon:yes gene_type:complete